MGWTRVEEFCMNSEAARRLQVEPQGVERAGACCIIKTSHAPSQLYTRLQD